MPDLLGTWPQVLASLPPPSSVFFPSFSVHLNIILEPLQEICLSSGKAAELIQDSEKVGEFLGEWNRETEIAKQNGRAIYSQIQMVTKGEAPSAWQGAKLGKQGPHPQSNLSSPGLPPWRQHPGLSYISASDPERQQNQVGNARTN